LKASLVQERGICVKLCRHVVLAARGQSHKWLCTIWLQLLSRLALWRSATQSYLQCLHIWHNLAQRHNGESHKKEPVVADMPFGTPEYDQPTGTHDPQWRAQCRIPLGAEINIIYRYQMQMGCTNRFSQTILRGLLPTNSVAANMPSTHHRVQTAAPRALEAVTHWWWSWDCAYGGSGPPPYAQARRLLTESRVTFETYLQNFWGEHKYQKNEGGAGY
jgi:hypothetical protein